ncbi:MAG: hypothetical protein ACXVCO_12790, partial [Ktedonobacterales bacterium]
DGEQAWSANKQGCNKSSPSASRAFDDAAVLERKYKREDKTDPYRSAQCCDATSNCPRTDLPGALSCQNTCSDWRNKEDECSGSNS